MKRALSLILILCLVFLLTGCSDEPEEYSVTFAIDGIPKTLDPQIASSDSELAVVYNTCEGLMRFSPDGTVVYGAAKTHSVSSDGLVYTFTLKEGLKWSDGQELSAKDFAFGLTRAVLPETNCPAVESFYAVKGAKDVFQNGADLSTLGISYSGNTVTITLLYPDEDILHTLACSAAMPCREDFFINSKGKYGLSDELFISSGPFYVKKWSQDTESVSLRISKSPEYVGDIEVKPASVVMFFNNQNDHITEMSEGQMGSAYMPASLYENAVKKDLNTTVRQSESFILSLNNAAPIFSTQKMREIFAKSIDRSVISSKLSYGSVMNNGIVPPSYMLNSKSYSDISPCSPIGYDATAADEYLDELSVIKDTLQARLDAEKKAEDDYLEAVKKAHEDKKPIPEKPKKEITPYSLYAPWDSKDTVETDLSIICLDSPYVTPVALAVASCWEKAFGITVSVKPLSKNELTSAAKQGNYFAAILSYESPDCNAKSFLYSFTSYSNQNHIKYLNEEYDNFIRSLQTDGVTPDKLNQAENMLVSSASVIPLFSASHMVASMPNISNISFVTPNGYIDFTQALNSD
ncbi:MAG: hypothetical protein IJ462_01990 [Clostridia bacterium]|nr:hypothetical protein [Clostridia bacterium]